MNELIIKWKNRDSAIYRFTTKGDAVTAKMILENHCGDEIEDIKIEALEQQPCEDKVQVLDKIRAEIEQSPVKTITNWNGCCPDFDCPEIEYVTKNEMLNIIDRYRTESEEDE